MGGKLTDMEKEALRRSREGKKMTGVQHNTPTGKPVVDLVEEAQGIEPMQVPGTSEIGLVDPAKLREQLAAEEERRTQTEEEQEVTSADLDKLRALAIGDAESDKEIPEEGADREEVEAIGPKKCDRCGWEIGKNSKEQPTEEDKQEFMRSILGERRFEKELTYLDGAVRVRYRSTMSSEEDMMVKTLRAMVVEGDVTTPEEWNLKYRYLQLIFCLKAIYIDDKVHEFGEVTFEEHKYLEQQDSFKAAAERLKKVPTTVRALLNDGLLRFNDVTVALTMRTHDADFWKGPTDSQV